MSTTVVVQRITMTYGSFVPYFALDATKSRISRGHLCWVPFSNVSWLRNAIEYANKRFKGLSTFYFTISTAYSCLHSLGGAFWASGRETNHIEHVFATRMPCGLFRFLKPRNPSLAPKECKQLHAVEMVTRIESAQALNLLLFKEALILIIVAML